MRKYYYSMLTNLTILLQVNFQHWIKEEKVKFFAEINNFFKDDYYFFKYYANEIGRRCVLESEFQKLLSYCYEQTCGGHFSTEKTTDKVLQYGFY